MGRQRNTIDLLAHIKDANAHHKASLFLPQYATAFIWQFKMVSVTATTTPLTGLTVTVQISKDIGAFAALTGAPAVTEKSDGWYYVTVPTSDMTADVVILKATALLAAQTDIVYYLR